MGRLINFAVLISISFLAISQCDEKKMINCPRIVSKTRWGGKLATGLNYQIRPIRYVIIHHTVTDECTNFVTCAEILQNIQNFHQNDLKYYDIGYNFLIGGDGKVYEGTGWGIKASHTYGYNANGTGIAFIGNFRAKLPSNDALDAVQRLLECGVESGELSNNYKLMGGSQVISTQSPGITLYSEIQDWDHWSPRP